MVSSLEAARSGQVVLLGILEWKGAILRKLQGGVMVNNAQVQKMCMGEDVEHIDVWARVVGKTIYYFNYQGYAQKLLGMNCKND